MYNDNVNDPKIKKWLGQVVGKESEDLSRHDKWLCMMYPRLKLLHKLLADDGAIFISIDDVEVHYLCLLLDEIFSKTNFVANIVWQKRTSPDARATIGAGHEHIIVYGKKWINVREKLNKLPLTEKQKKAFKNPDNDPKGPWVSSDFTAQGYRPNQMYKVTTPSGNSYSPPDGRCWMKIESEYERLKLDGRLWFGNNGDGVPRIKTYLNEREGIAAWTWWPNDEVGHNQEGKQEVNSIFKSATIFDTPKPSRLIERILQLYVNSSEYILDSFAGSGTTAHAVLNLNKQDNGSRKFILIEMEDYADSITAERVKRVIAGYGEGKNAVEGTGGAFDYYELGPPLFIGEHQEFLNEEIGIERMREYIFYSETQQPLSAQQTDDYYLGSHNGVAIYFYYDKDQLTALNHEFLSRVTVKANSYILYADTCLLADEFMKANYIVFKKIPRDITRF